MFAQRWSEQGRAEALEEALYGVKSARLQLGTFSHLSGDLVGSLAPLHGAAESAAGFLSRRGNACLVAAAVIACAFLLNLARAWPRARAIRGA